MTLRLARLLSITLAVLALAGCLDRERRDNSLEATLHKYEVTIRWGRLADAYLFMRIKEGEQPEIPPGLDEVRVTGYEVLRPVVHLGENRAAQVVQIEYLFRDRQVVRKLVDQQTWEYDEDAGRWYLASPVARFR